MSKVVSLEKVGINGFVEGFWLIHYDCVVLCEGV